MRTLPALLVAVVIGAVLVSCGGKSKTKDGDVQDGPSYTGIRASDVKDAVPREEPLARYGNHSPYEVFGKKYTVMSSSRGYREVGTASWYGSKFHGRRTSSGEVYDMHLATAAHKSLPLPTYAEVTNLDNGRSVIVKVNDRGPFKGSRIIDLSYGAALRLGMIGTGTARVEVRAISPSDDRSGSRMVAAGSTGSQSSTGSTDDHGLFLQMGAFRERDGAESLANELRKDDMVPVSINKQGGYHKVWLGPYLNEDQANAIILRAVELGFDRPHKVRR
ncbi:MAG: septal ring lytic transglycosylase RlpA family protein [Xanthomonadales bacterium]|nr:septal ring lytic transglycosylase RlpA family protein [Xanthomonadales bacterium]